MRTFLFRVDQPDGDVIEKSRTFSKDPEATAYARQLLDDWPDCKSIDILHDGDLVDRVRQVRT